MILVDTSIWVDRIRQGDSALAEMLNNREVLAHPFVIGELALGTWKNRQDVLRDMRDLPLARIADDDEVLRFIETNTMFGIRIGYVDAHLLAATRLTPSASIWTRDKRLRAAAERMSLSAISYH